MRPPPKSGSIAARLTWMNALVSGIALLMAYVSFVAYNLVTTREALVNSLTAEAQIIGTNSALAILFNDRASAEMTLSALSNSSDVVSAAIYTQSGELFVKYPANGTAPVPPKGMPANSLRYSSKRGIDVLIGSRIIYQGKPAGAVYIQAHLTGLRQQAIRYAGITAGILLLCLGVALLIGTLFRRRMSEPIVGLARTARLVSRYRDYSLRFDAGHSYDELTLLTNAFNEMLAEIQQQDAALERARNELELRVEERTAQLRAANRELESFSYTVAHDLRGPLEIISNICYLLRDQARHLPVEATDPMLTRLASSVAEMSALIEDLLNLSRATSAGLHLKRLDLSDMASFILADLAAANPNRNVKTVVQQGCHANGDKGLMQIVLQNLLRNAWKFTGHKESARIEFGCLPEGPQTIYFVRDDGAGFDQRMADKLFKPFQRLHTENEFSGTGIGLATVQRIIARHDGKVWAEGEVGKGAIVYFTLGSPAP